MIKLITGTMCIADLAATIPSPDASSAWINLGADMPPLARVSLYEAVIREVVASGKPRIFVTHDELLLLVAQREAAAGTLQGAQVVFYEGETAHTATIDGEGYIVDSGGTVGLLTRKHLFGPGIDLPREILALRRAQENAARRPNEPSAASQPSTERPPLPGTPPAVVVPPSWVEALGLNDSYTFTIRPEAWTAKVETRWRKRGVEHVVILTPYVWSSAASGMGGLFWQDPSGRVSPRAQSWWVSDGRGADGNGNDRCGHKGDLKAMVAELWPGQGC